MNRFTIFLFIMFIGSITEISASNENLKKARDLFYESIEDEGKIEPAMELFREIGQKKEYYGRSLAYIGTLYALKGKHSFLPHNKLKWVLKGLDKMDKGIEKSPNDLEALFIFGATCIHLPFFFNRDDDAERAFDKIIEMLPQKIDNYDTSLIIYVIDFLQEKAKLESSQEKILANIKTELKSDEHRISDF
ncbi:hypothetical protein GF337_16580 [candidate division KSB1 bacterium]|nr:hypothetical protein [candidate division KSB1 bacterium]